MNDLNLMSAALIFCVIGLVVMLVVLSWLTMSSLLTGWGSEKDPIRAATRIKGWSSARFTWFSESAGSYRRDRFARDARGNLRHYVDYCAQPDGNAAGGGTEVTKMDRERGLDLEQLARDLGCKIQDE